MVATAAGARSSSTAEPPDDDVDHVVVDLADGRAAEAAVDEVAAAAGRSRRSCTAAGIDACGPLVDVDADAWERVVRVNLLGTVAVVRAALPHLRSTRGARRDGRLHARAARRARRHRLLRQQVRRRRLHPGPGRRAGRFASASRCSCPGGMQTPFFDGRTEQYRPPPDAKLNRPEDVAAAVVFALDQPAGCEVRELVVCPSTESSWP